MHILSEKNIKLVSGATAAAYINGEPVSNEVVYTVLGGLIGLTAGMYIAPPMFLIGLYTNMAYGTVAGATTGYLAGCGKTYLDNNGITEPFVNTKY